MEDTELVRCRPVASAGPAVLAKGVPLEMETDGRGWTEPDDDEEVEGEDEDEDEEAEDEAGGGDGSSP